MRDFKRRLKGFIAAGLIFLGVGSQAFAGALTSIQDVKINISGLGNYSKQCGLSREAFERAFLAACRKAVFA